MTFYKPVAVDITPAQIKSAARGGAITLSKQQLAGSGAKIYVHPDVYKNVMKAKKKGTGVRIHWSPEGALTTANLEGGSIGDWIKKAWNFAKKNYDVIKPVLTRIADVAVPAAATALGQPSLAIPARQAISGLTGVGIKPKLTKGSPEMKQHMANLRARRGKASKAGASFRLN